MNIFVLILTLITHGAVGVTSHTFANEKACEAAGSAWISANKHSLIRIKTFVCVKEYIK